MQIKEEFIDGEGDMFHVKRTFDPNPTLDRLQNIRERGHELGESYHVGTVPGWMLAEWLKEAGVRYDDVHARNELLKRKLQSGDFSALRNWKGNF